MDQNGKSFFTPKRQYLSRHCNDKTEKNTTETVLESLDMLIAAQKQKIEIFNIIEDSDTVDFNDYGELTVNKNLPKLPSQHFSTTYYNQTKNVKLKLNIYLVPNKTAKIFRTLVK